MPGLDLYTKLLIHGTGTNGSTSFSDSSDSSHTVTPIGSTKINTSIIDPFGGYSGVIELDGNSDYLRMPDSNDWNFGTADFTIDFWVRNREVKNQFWWLQYDNGTNYMGLYTNGSTYFNVDNASTALPVDKFNGATAGVSIVLNQWHHVAFVRYGNDWRQYLNGNDVTSTQPDLINQAFPDANLTGYFTVGGGLFLPQFCLNGFMSEFRVSKGVARWRSSFTPPTSRYSPPLPTMIVNPNVASYVTIADSKAVLALENASTADSKAIVVQEDASTADSKAIVTQESASTADSKAVVAQSDASTADSKAVVAQSDASTADSKAVVATADASTADSKAVVAANEASTADSKAVVADSKAVSAADEASTADSKAVVATSDASTADSKAVVADSKAVSAADEASTADSKAVVADSKAVSAADEASVADSKAVIAQADASTADSKAVVAQSDASTADSKAVVADSIADAASEAVASAIGSEPGVGDYLVTDIKRNAAGSFVIDYDDSQIT